jgi:hypothetical protein
MCRRHHYSVRTFYIPWFLSKFWVCVIEILPLLGIRWMSKFSIVLALIRGMPGHKFSIILRVSEQTHQPINHCEVSHHQSKNPSLRIIVYLFFAAGGFRTLLGLL